MLTDCSRPGKRAQPPPRSHSSPPWPPAWRPADGNFSCFVLAATLTCIEVHIKQEVQYITLQRAIHYIIYIGGNLDLH